MFLYTLKLQNDCWYVGTTKDPSRRLQEHYKGRGAEWTRVHTPIELSTEYPLSEIKSENQAVCRLDEDKQVKLIMLDKGVHAVRGGSYLRPVLSHSDVKSLCKELFHANGGCLRCGRQNHRATKCYAIKDVVGNVIDGDDQCPPASSRERESSLSRKHEAVSSRKHEAVSSRKREAVSSQKRKAKSSQKREAVSSPKRKAESSQKREDKKYVKRCSRCRRFGHWVSTCNAKSTADGQKLC
mmetsp:Transcript_6178/g.9150  ORF Transcript_6178/g.9150 Transcript_6178/m.9150 type:complete len:240 (-) Transcript_6178:386-1105(-)